MEFICTHCQQTARIPDERIPNRAFALTCKSCKKRFRADPGDQTRPTLPRAQVDLSSAGEGDGESVQTTFPTDLGSDLGSGPPPATATKTTASGSTEYGSFRPLRSLQLNEKQLLDQLSPVAGIVDLTGSETELLEKALDLVGMHELNHYDSVEAAATAMTELDLGVVLIKIEKATLPPLEILKSIQSIPMPIRRRTVVALMADNLTSHNGQIAFFLQVNLTLSAKEMPKLPELLRRGILHHLQLYRYWNDW